MSAPAELLGRTLILVAHPDDEAVGGGVLLQRMRQPIVVFATDGAPRSEFFWKTYGSRASYARRRQEEARAALALAGVDDVAFLAETSHGEAFVDQELHLAIPEAMAELSAIVRRRRPRALLTSAYEGGHPDHDICSFLGAILARQHGLPVWEFPLYHRRDPNRPAFQQFLVPGEREEIELQISSEEAEIKRRMLATYSSQRAILLSFTATLERLRPQPAYDYSRLPHSGTLNYEAWGWPITGGEVCASMTGFLQTRRRVPRWRVL